MRSTKKFLFALVGLLWSAGAFAQTVRDVIGRFDVAGYPGNDFPVVLTFPASVPASLSAVVYNTGTSIVQSADRQPIVTVAGNKATVTFQFPRRSLQWQGYFELTWSGKRQVSGNITGDLNNRGGAAPITTLTVKGADGVSVPISLIGGSGSAGGVSPADVIAVGDGRYYKLTDPFSYTALRDRPAIPTVPSWLPPAEPGYRNEQQVNALIATALTSVQGSLSSLSNDIQLRVPFSTYSTNRTADQSLISAAQATANNANLRAQDALGATIDIKSQYVPITRRIRVNGGNWQTFGADVDLTVDAGQAAGVNTVNGRNGNVTGLAEQTDLTSAVNRISAVESGKVNVVPGQGLSDVNFTIAQRDKLAGVAPNATNVTNTNQLTNGADFATNTTVTNLGAAKQDKLTFTTPLTAGNTSVGTLTVGSNTNGVLTLGGFRLTKSDGFPFQFETGIQAQTVQATGVTSSTITADIVRIPGATPEETDKNTIRRSPVGYLELGGNARFGPGGIGAGGNLDLKPDGNLLIQSNSNGNRSIFMHNEGISVNRGTNTARAGFDVGSSMLVDGNFSIPAVNDRYFGFDGLVSGQTVRLRMGDNTGGIDAVWGQPIVLKGYHGTVLQNQAGGASPALRVNGLSSGQRIFEFYNAANQLRSALSQDGTFDVTQLRFPNGSVQTVAATASVTTAPTVVSIAADQTALLNAIANQVGPTLITWTGTITQTADIEIRYKNDLELNCFGRGTLARSNSPSQIVVRGDVNRVAIRGINFVNTSTGSNGNIILINEQGPTYKLYIQYCTFVNTGTNNNAISSNASGGASDQFITSHSEIYVQYNKFGGAVMPGGGISRMAVELKNHSADGAGPIQYSDGIHVDYNEIFNCGTGSDDGFGISLSGLFRFGTMSFNVLQDCERYSLEGVLLSDFVIEFNTVTDINNTSNGVSLSNGYKDAANLPIASNRKIKVRNNTFDVKGRAILSYYVTNSEFTGNVGKSQLRNEWIGDENVITNNRFEVFNDWNAMYFAKSSRNRIIGNTGQTFLRNNPDNGSAGTYTSSVIFIDNASNNSLLRKNTLIRPVGSYNVHIEQASGLSNDIGAAAGSATNTTNTYVDRRPGTVGDDVLIVTTYDQMIAVSASVSVTTIYVTSDTKNNGGKTSVYTILPNGKRLWIAANEDN